MTRLGSEFPQSLSPVNAHHKIQTPENSNPGTPENSGYNQTDAKTPPEYQVSLKTIINMEKKCKRQKCCLFMPNPMTSFSFKSVQNNKVLDNFY